jgi:hypothetical protein
MRRNQIPSAAERERLLAGERLEGQRLSELLAAATVSAHSAEPPGLESALAAFRSAPAVVAAPPARRTPVLKSLLSGLVATKVIAGVAGAAAVGGVALAASTGHLGDGGHSADAPGQAIAAAHQPDATDSGSMSSSSDDSSSASTSDSSSASSSESSTHAPTPSLVGLCHAWQAHERSQSDHSASAAHSAWAKSPAFSVLVSTAGGTDGVDGYCTALLTPSASASTTPTSVPPTHPTHPAHPTQAVTTHPNHKPTAVPSHSHPAPSHTNHKPTATASASATPSA